MSDMMKSFDTEPLMYELNNVLNAELSKMLSKYVDRYNLLENTHKQIMNLPSVRAEMNRENDSDSDSSDDITSNNKDFDVVDKLVIRRPYFYNYIDLMSYYHRTCNWKVHYID